jgi:hypothetical protein
LEGRKHVKELKMNDVVGLTEGLDASDIGVDEFGLAWSAGCRRCGCGTKLQTMAGTFVWENAMIDAW